MVHVYYAMCMSAVQFNVADCGTSNICHVHVSGTVQYGTCVLCHVYVSGTGTVYYEYVYYIAIVMCTLV